MGLAYASDEFKTSIVEGLTFMSENKGPYLFHCTEGKDRTGFFGALLESLMGASKEEIVEDYMQSYINYYGVNKGTDQYKLISEDVLAMLKVIAGTDDLDNANFASAAENYLLSGGMTSEQIEILKTNLSTEMVAPKEEKADEIINTENNGKEDPTKVDTAEATYYIVVKGDCLWNIAKNQLGDGTRYIEIYMLNKSIIKIPDMIMIGQQFVLPEK